MRDQDDGHAGSPLQAEHELQHVFLNSDVERRRRLIGNQEFRIARKRHGDHDPLSLSAGHLVRKAVDPANRIGNAHEIQQVQRTFTCTFSRHAAMLNDCLHDLVADPIDRIQAGHRFLKYHGHLVSHHAPTLPGRKRQEVPALKVH